MFFFGGGQNPNWDRLRILDEWVTVKVLKLDIEPGRSWGQQLVLDVARKNAKMVAGWQRMDSCTGSSIPMCTFPSSWSSGYG